MGCVASRIDKEERVRICKERRRLMKQLLGLRGEFADAQLAYLRALRNTGVTLRQFTESESLELEDTRYGPALPPLPPPPLPPSPPPPPAFSPDLRRFEGNQTFEDDHKVEAAQVEIIEIDEDNSSTPPPPPVPSSSWDFWDPFGPSSPQCLEKSDGTVEQVEEENWAEANTEFEEEEQEGEVVACSVVNILPEKQQTVELVDDNSSLMSWHTKDTADMAMILWRSKKNLAGIVKELDDYFLKASAGGKDVAVLMDINVADTFLYQSIKENKRKRGDSARVFSGLSWNWSSRSLQISRDGGEFSGSSEPCRLGAHCVTLENLYTEEQRLYKLVKEEEIAKLEHERKSLLLQKQEDEHNDWMKTEKIRSSVESLQSDIIGLQQSISGSCSTILKLIDEDLYPQLLALTSGLMHMWQTMYECHQVQNHISRQMNHVSNQHRMEPTTNYHRHAACQLKTEVTSWYDSFCNLMKSQREYVRALCNWIKLTDCLVDAYQQSSCSSTVHALCEEWQLVLDRLPDKVASEAIKSFLSAINSIALQQCEELILQKRSSKLEKKLQKELSSLAEMEMKFDGNSIVGGAHSILSPKHPLSIKRAKLDIFKKQVDDEKAKYLNSVNTTNAMTFNGLQTSLPNVFQALMGFSIAYPRDLKIILNRAKPADSEDGLLNPIC